jgi:molybdate transport system substrate-binding protein
MTNSNPPLRILSSMAIKDVLGRMAQRYQEQTGQAVLVESVGGVDVAKRVRAGEVLDIVAIASDTIDALTAETHLRAGSRVDLVTSGIAVAVGAGAAQPALRNEQEVKQAVLAAKSISYSTGPSGVYLEKLFAQWGIFEQIKPRIVLAAPGLPVGGIVAKGQAALGFQQYSELMHVAGIDIVGPLPDDIQLVTTFSAGLSKRSQNSSEASALLAFMTSPSTIEIKRACGMENA